MQGILISLATALTLAILGAFAAPLVVDWNAWRGTFEREIGRTLGVPVVIRGDIAAELLPAPRLTLKDVTLGDVVSTGGTVRQFQAELSLGALMRGEVEATGVSLLRPHLRIVIDSNGRLALPTGAGRAADIGIARLEVRDGALDLLDRASDQTFALSDLDLRGEARSLSGPFKLDGEVEAAGARFGLRATLGKLDAAGAGKLRLTLDGRNRPYAVDLEGTFSTLDATPGFDGRASLARKGAAGLDSWQLSGHLKASPAQVLADNLELALGGAATPAQLAGAARLTLGRAIGLDVVLNARSLDLDALGAGGEATAGASPAIRPAEAIGRGLWMLADLPTPDIASRIGVSAEQLVLGGTVVRDVRLDITGARAGWRVDLAEAQLPGKAALKASGAPDAGGFSGALAFTAEDPAAFLRWAAPDAARDVAAAIGAPARITTRLKLSPGRIGLDGLDASFGPSRLTGTLAAAFPTGGAPKLDLKLTLDGFALDPIVAGLQRAAAAVGGGADASAVLDGQNLTIAGQPLGRLAFDAAATGGNWRVKRLMMDDLGGIHLEGAGWMENFSTTPRGEFNLSLSGAKADGLVPVARLVAGPETADVLARLAPVAAPVKLSTAVTWNEAGGRGITSAGSLGQMSGQVSFTRSAAGVPLAVALTAEAADAAPVLGALGLTGLNPRLGAARGEFTLSPLTPGEGQVRVKLATAGLTLAGEGPARLVNGAIEPQLAVRADGADLGRLLPQVAAAADNAPVPAALAFGLTRTAGLWQMANIEGSVGGAPVTGTLGLEPGTVPRLSGRLAFDTLSVPAIVGLLGARAPGAEATPATPWSGARLQPGPVNGVALGVDLVASRLALIGPYVLSGARLRLASDGIDLDLRDITGGFGGGRVSAALQVRNRAEGVEADGRLLLDKVDIPPLAMAGGARTPPAGRVSLALDLGGIGRTPLQLVQSLSGQGTLAVQALKVSGADPTALDAVLAETASLPAPPDERRTALLFDRALLRGPLVVPAADSTLAVVNGVVRLSPARTSVGDTRLSVSGSLDLARLLMEAAIDYEGPAQSGVSPTGTLAWRGTVSAPDRRVSASGLTGVIAMRAIERETRRLEEQRGATPAAPSAASASAPAPAASTPAPARAAPGVPQDPAATAPRPVAPAAPRPSARASDTIERHDLAAPAPSPFGTATGTPAAGAGTGVTAPAATPPVPAPPEAPVPVREAPTPTATAAPPPPPAAQPPRPSTVRPPLPQAVPMPAPAAPQAQARPQEAPPRPGPRPAVPVVRPPLPLEPTLPPTRGFGDLPRPPGLVGE
ncbi:AsmA family protein [Xanthobacter sp. V4C-4]|uniref:AsmA family protein n=1 Tax=Xanthobacter cornucopiae TaxID=3119924 RepID=UPI00372AF946